MRSSFYLVPHRMIEVGENVCVDDAEGLAHHENRLSATWAEMGAPGTERRQIGDFRDPVQHRSSTRPHESHDQGAKSAGPL